MNIKLTHDLTSEEADYIGERLSTFNRESAPPSMKKIKIDVDLALRNDSGKVVGGLIGKIYRSCLFVDTLWIEETARGYGYGKTLMIEAEKLARAQDCIFIHLDTFSFQAPEFYKSLGFEVFGLLDEYPGELKRFYMKKMLK